MSFKQIIFTSNILCILFNLHVTISYHLNSSDHILTMLLWFHMMYHIHFLSACTFNVDLIHINWDLEANTFYTYDVKHISNLDKKYHESFFINLLFTFLCYLYNITLIIIYGCLIYYLHDYYIFVLINSVCDLYVIYIIYLFGYKYIKTTEKLCTFKHHY